MRRIRTWLSEVIWTAVIAVALAVGAGVLAVFGFELYAQVSVVASIPFAILSIRS